jgi:hypothetical protein
MSQLKRDDKRGQLENASLYWENATKHLYSSVFSGPDKARPRVQVHRQKLQPAANFTPRASTFASKALSNQQLGDRFRGENGMTIQEFLGKIQ